VTPGSSLSLPLSRPMSRKARSPEAAAAAAAAAAAFEGLASACGHLHCSLTLVEETFLPTGFSFIRRAANVGQ